VEEAVNGVETLRMESGEQQEVKEPRVTKAQKRRVRRSSKCSVLPPTADMMCPLLVQNEATFFSGILIHNTHF